MGHLGHLGNINMKNWISSHKVFSTLARSFLKNPWQHQLMEFRYGLWTGISSIYGDDERQLGEGNTRPKIFNDHVPAEVHPCKYKGTREHKLINVSALRVAMSHFYEASAITVAVRDYHMAKAKKLPTDIPGIWDQHVISRASLALTAYRYRAGNLAANVKLSNNIGSQYKLVTGIFVICREMMNRLHPASKLNAPVSPQEMYDYADKHYLFRSSNGMVCAGSASKIIEFLEFSHLGRAHQASDKLGLNEEGADLALLRSFVPDLESWYQYALMTIEFDCFIEMEALRRKIDADPDKREQIEPILDIYRIRHNYWKMLLGDYKSLKIERFEDGALDRQNAILTHLNLPSIKNIPRKVLNSRLNH